MINLLTRRIICTACPSLAPRSHRKWHSCEPVELLNMNTPVTKFVAEDKKELERLLMDEGRKAR